MSWHVSPEMATSYRVGELAGARAASVEAHVLACEHCRGLLRSTDSLVTQRLDTIWDAVEDQVDQPRITFIERLLIFCRVPADEARLLASAPSLQMSWLVALLSVVGGTSLLSQQANRFTLVFVVLAPVLQVISVAAAYGPHLDPTYELTRSTPYPTARLLMLRTVAVLAVSLLLTTVAAFTLTDLWAAAAWLLPSLALVSVTLLLTKWIDLNLAGSVVCVAYLFAVTSALFNDATVRSIFGSPVQLAAIAVTLVCGLILFGPSAERAQIRRKS